MKTIDYHFIFSGIMLIFNGMNYINNDRYINGFLVGLFFFNFLYIYIKKTLFNN